MFTSPDPVTDYPTMTRWSDRHVREVWWSKGRLDGTSVDSQNGHNYTGQEKWGKLIHIAYADEYHQDHEDQEGGAIDTHVI